MAEERRPATEEEKEEPREKDPEERGGEGRWADERGGDAVLVAKLRPQTDELMPTLQSLDGWCESWVVEGRAGEGRAGEVTMGEALPEAETEEEALECGDGGTCAAAE